MNPKKLENAEEVIEKCKARLKDLSKRYRTAKETAKGKSDRLNLLGATDAESVRTMDQILFHQFFFGFK